MDDNIYIWIVIHIYISHSFMYFFAKNVLPEDCFLENIVLLVIKQNQEVKIQDLFSLYSSTLLTSIWALLIYHTLFKWLISSAYKIYICLWVCVCVCVCVCDLYIYMYIYVCVCVCVSYIYIYICIYMCVCLCVRVIYIYIYICLCLCVSYIYIYIYVCVCVCVCVC